MTNDNYNGRTATRRRILFYALAKQTTYNNVHTARNDSRKDKKKIRMYQSIRVDSRGRCSDWS